MKGESITHPLKGSNTLFHLLAFITVCVWGITFVSTKILINAGLSPREIFAYRFLIAYLCILTVSHKRLLAHNIKDEGLMCLAGLSGGSLYFIAENTALGITLASDVSLIICTAPIFTMLLGRLILHVPLRRKMFGGSLIALCGVGFVVFNGSFNLGINPLGDLLTMTAAILWAIYCIILKVIGRHYSIFFITRKVFFYGLLSVALTFIFYPRPIDMKVLSQPVVYGNLLFLGVIASMACYMMWNSAVKALGAEKTANYIYCIPLITILTAIIFLSEAFTIFTFIGTALIIGGVYLAER